MEHNFEVGDFVVSDDVEGKVIEVLDLAGDIYLKVRTPAGDQFVRGQDVELCKDAG